MTIVAGSEYVVLTFAVDPEFRLADCGSAQRRGCTGSWDLGAQEHEPRGAAEELSSVVRLYSVIALRMVPNDDVFGRKQSISQLVGTSSSILQRASFNDALVRMHLSSRGDMR